MARRGQRAAKVFPGNSKDPESLTAWVIAFLESLKVRGYSLATVGNREYALKIFLAWCEQRSLSRPHMVSRPVLLRFQRYLFLFRQKNGKPLSGRTQHARLVAVRLFFKWLTRENVILSNPASELDLPKKGKPLPQQILTPKEAEEVLNQPDIKDPLGVRDRAILEVLYSTGIRRTEAVNLKLFDLDWNHGRLRIRVGKGDKERVVPIGERALAWCEKYLREVRPSLLYGKEESWLFLTRRGDGFTPNGLTKLASEYIELAQIGKSGACHIFRHTMATAMLENGADIRFIQEMLGHSNLETTQIYTRVSIHKLKEIHTATHPSAKLGHRPKESAEPTDSNEKA